MVSIDMNGFLFLTSGFVDGHLSQRQAFGLSAIECWGTGSMKKEYSLAFDSLLFTGVDVTCRDMP